MMMMWVTTASSPWSHIMTIRTHTLTSPLTSPQTNVLVAWLVNLVYSSILVAASSCSVVFGAPAAAGAGVAEVMAFLNGVRIPKVFSVRTLLVKFFSCAMAVGSGLPVGPEGPMVHIGALLGGALSQGQSTSLQCSTGSQSCVCVCVCVVWSHQPASSQYPCLHARPCKSNGQHSSQNTRSFCICNHFS